MKNQLQGVSLILFGALLEFVNKTDYWDYDIVRVFALIFGTLGLIITFKEEILKILRKLNEEDDESGS